MAIVGGGDAYRENEFFLVWTRDVSVSLNDRTI